MKWKLKVNKIQNRVIHESLYMYASVGVGRFEDILSVYKDGRAPVIEHCDMGTVEGAVHRLTEMVGGPYHVTNTKGVNKEFTEAWRMYTDIKPRQRVITLEGESSYVLTRALDFFSRMGLGQLREIGWIVRWYFDSLKKMSYEEFDGVDEMLNYAKALLTGFPSNASWGIYCPEIHDDFRVAWDLQQVVRHRVSWDAVGNPPRRQWPEMMGVNYDTPMHSSEQSELAKIERIDDEEIPADRKAEA